MRAQRLSRLLLAFLTCFALPAFAQDASNREVIDRMDKMERDMMTIQRQLARGGSDTGGLITAGNNLPPGESAASLEVRLSSMEDEMRNLRGKTEENAFQIKKLTESLSKFQQDVDFRFSEAARPGPAPDDKNPAAAKPGLEGEEEGSTPGDGALHIAPDAAKAAENFENPRDHYNYAFRLLNQTRYEDAAGYFKDFTGKYPKDPLIGNAYYWLGETFYIRRDYVQAADNFRQGFEALPGGPKAADNLLKLSMSLSALKKNQEACVVLDQLLVKFKETSPTVAQKAETERTRIGCK